MCSRHDACARVMLCASYRNIHFSGNSFYFALLNKAIILFFQPLFTLT